VIDAPMVRIAREQGVGDLGDRELHGATMEDFSPLGQPRENKGKNQCRPGVFPDWGEGRWNRDGMRRIRVGGEVPLLRPRPLSGLVRFWRFLEEFGRDQVV
jgi:hypothetical protein